MIAYRNIFKSFGHNTVLKDISIQFEEGVITAIMGPNGSGKTTLIKSFLGLVIPDKGVIDFRETNILRSHDYRNQVAHLPQIARFPENLTAAEIISMIKDLREGKTNEEYFIGLFNLSGEMNKKMGTLSGGNRQKVNLVLALMYDTPIIILDEPGTGLDPNSRINLKKYLDDSRSSGKTILITTHMINFVEEMADNVLFLMDGKVYFDGSLQTLLKEHNGVGLEKAIANILHPGKLSMSHA